MRFFIFLLNLMKSIKNRIFKLLMSQGLQLNI